MPPFKFPPNLLAKDSFIYLILRPHFTFTHTIMRRYTFLLLITPLFFAACQGDENGVREIRDGNGPNANLVRNPATADMPLDTNNLARIVFEESVFDFGTINEGDIVEHRYKFTNTGKVPLSILDARSSCGCTTPEWPKEQIPPGGTGEIYAKFNSEGRTKEQSKLIMITANTYPNETKVKLKGFVKE